MAIKPNTTYEINGVKVNEKIIPDGTVWKDDAKAKKAGFAAGELYKRQYPINHGTGKPNYVTIHNTKGHSGIDDEGELYTRATYNENMSSARVHFYVDNNGAWQNLKAGLGKSKNDPINSCEVSWHAGDGSAAEGGNYQSISMEVIMGETAEIDAKSYDNAARLAAWILWYYKLPVTRLVTHTYWVNKKANKTFTDVDEQCCNLISGKKWCPTYIFKSTKKAEAMKNWKEFKQVVQSYIDKLDNKVVETPVDEKVETTVCNVKVNDIVDFVGTKHYTNNNALIGKTCKPGKAKVTAITKTGKHKYHLIAVAGGGSNVYGWVDEVDIITDKSTNILVGDKVRLMIDATVYNSTKRFSNWVYKSDLYVRSIDGSKVAVSVKMTGAITGRVDIKYLIK